MLPVGDVLEDLGLRLHFAHKLRDRRVFVQDLGLEVAHRCHVFCDIWNDGFTIDNVWKQQTGNNEVDPGDARGHEEAAARQLQQVHVDGEVLLHVGQENCLAKCMLENYLKVIDWLLVVELLLIDESSFGVK